MKQLLILVTLLISYVGEAQPITSWGLQARLGASAYRPVEPGNTNHPLPTYGASVYADLPISQYVSFRPQLGWLRKGFGQTNNVFSGPGGQLVGVIESQFSYDYLPLDLTLVLRARPGKTLRPFLQAGGRAGLLIDNRLKRTSTNQTLTGSVGLDNYQRLTIGLLVGAGLEWKRLAVGLEINPDLSTYLRVPSFSGFEDYKPTLLWYGFTLSYQLRSF